MKDQAGALVQAPGLHAKPARVMHWRGSNLDKMVASETRVSAPAATLVGQACKPVWHTQHVGTRVLSGIANIKSLLCCARG